jgi:hypothetical protein
MAGADWLDIEAHPQRPTLLSSRNRGSAAECRHGESGQLNDEVSDEGAKSGVNCEANYSEGAPDGWDGMSISPRERFE